MSPYDQSHEPQVKVAEQAPLIDTTNLLVAIVLLLLGYVVAIGF